MTTLNYEMLKLQEEVEKYAVDFGLDFFPITYELLDYRQMNEVVAYVGFPVRYPHWKFGQEYERMSKQYAYGLSRIYEIVLNSNPALAYLLASNLDVDQKMVMAHVCGHSDFFKNNIWFGNTNRKMVDEMANHATRIRKYISKYGYNEVEEFLDACLSVEDLIDRTLDGVIRYQEINHTDDENEINRIPTKSYMDQFINTEDFIEKQKKEIEKQKKKAKTFPENPERDVLLFILQNSPLEEWQRDILEIVREESYYFIPQKQTKVTNEGWAVLGHVSIMQNYAMKSDELINFADHNSGVLAASPGHLNPYRLGYNLLLDIWDRWDRGAFGREYEECNNYQERKSWNKYLGLGKQKVFEVRKFCSDISFLDTYLTEDFCREQKLFGFKVDSYGDEEEDTRDFEEIKMRLLFQLTNFGNPLIEVIDGNFRNRGELLLKHKHEGIDLDIPYALDTLKGLYKLWGRPVHILTGTKMYTGDSTGAAESNLGDYTTTK